MKNRGAADMISVYGDKVCVAKGMPPRKQKSSQFSAFGHDDNIGVTVTNQHWCWAIGYLDFLSRY